MGAGALECGLSSGATVSTVSRESSCKVGRCTICQLAVETSNHPSVYLFQKLLLLTSISFYGRQISQVLSIDLLAVRVIYLQCTKQDGQNHAVAVAEQQHTRLVSYVNCNARTCCLRYRITIYSTCNCNEPCDTLKDYSLCWYHNI